jgi:hypothetical protein
MIFGIPVISTTPVAILPPRRETLKMQASSRGEDQFPFRLLNQPLRVEEICSRIESASKEEFHSGK